MSESHQMAVAVELLGTNADARKAVVSWGIVPKSITDRDDIVEAWSIASGVDALTLDPIAEMLFAHGICLADRTVDPMATRVIEHMAAEFLRKRIPKAPKGPKPE